MGRPPPHPLFVQTHCGHGRVEARQLHAFPIEPLRADFPSARSLLVLRSQRTIKQTGHTTTESRFYLSSDRPEEHRAEQWLDLTRGHWGGVEVRNHWRRDAVLGEDRFRRRHPNLLANVALLRNTILALLAQHHPDQSRPRRREQFHSRPACRLPLLNS